MVCGSGKGIQDFSRILVHEKEWISAFPGKQFRYKLCREAETNGTDALPILITQQHVPANCIGKQFSKRMKENGYI